MAIENPARARPDAALCASQRFGGIGLITSRLADTMRSRSVGPSTPPARRVSKPTRSSTSVEE
eukprot:7515-Prymnesium_polylepis.1